MQEDATTMTAEDKSQVANQVEQQVPSAESKAEVTEAATPPEEKGPDVASLQQEIEKQKKLAEYHLEQWKRTAADLENYRKRVDKERADWLKFGQASLFTQLLPVLDDLDRAFQTLPAVLRNLSWVEGLVLIDRKLRLVLEQRGLKEIETDGKPFDPSVHQAVLHEENNAYPDGQVIATVQKGYMLHDRVLRPAMVVVAKNTSSKTAEAKENGASAEQASKEEHAATE
jgi:molecular chaperone GrpE